MVAVTGAFSIVTPAGSQLLYPVATQNGILALRMLAQGGQPPYWWRSAGQVFAVTGTSGTQYAMSNFGWLMALSAVQGPIRSTSS